MDRREFLKFSAMIGTGFALNSLMSPSVAFSQLAVDESQPLYCGWEHSAESRRIFISRNPKPFMNQLDDSIRGSGEGKTALLWKALETVTGHPLKTHVQTIGDCVSHAYGLGVDILTAVQIVNRNSPQRWVAESATELIYAGSRIEVGKNIYNRGLRGDGSEGTWAAEYIKRWGVLLRQKYSKYDFSIYDGDVARSLGYKGVPDELEPMAKCHPVGNVALVNSYKEARDCLYNNYPVIFCSSQGFMTKHGLDRDGFLSPSRNSWMHAMVAIGVDDNKDRPGICIQNSWEPSWISGPKRHDQPEGSFWIDASVADRMAKQGDTLSISQYAGYPRNSYDLY